MELWRRGSSTWHEEGRWEWGQCIRILKDRASRRAERQTHVQLQDGLIFCFICRCCVGVQASSLVTVLLGGKGGRQDNPVSCSLFTRLTLNSSSRQLKESWTLLSLPKSTALRCVLHYILDICGCMCLALFPHSKNMLDPHVWVLSAWVLHVLPVPMSMFSTGTAASSHSSETCPRVY